MKSAACLPPGHELNPCQLETWILASPPSAPKPFCINSLHDCQETPILSAGSRVLRREGRPGHRQPSTERDYQKRHWEADDGDCGDRTGPNRPTQNASVNWFPVWRKLPRMIGMARAADAKQIAKR